MTRNRKRSNAPSAAPASETPPARAGKPRVLLIGTGGTIAGAARPEDGGRYRAGAIAIGRLVEDAPDLGARFDLDCEQPFSIGSQHFTSGHWLALARRVCSAAQDPTIDAVVIAHGTDTLEETAFVLDLLCPRTKPVVLTGAMRPATALGADGPVNLRSACLVATDAAAAGRGVLVALNDQAWSAAHVGKRHSMALQAFDGGEREAQATITGTTVRWRQSQAMAVAEARLRPSFENVMIASSGQPRLPIVVLVWQHVDADPGVVGWHLDQGARGIVLAATGAGTMPDPMRAALAAAAGSGCLVVRATRVGAGPVIRDSEPEPGDRDGALGFVAAGNVPALKARILAQCCIASGLATNDLTRVQAAFDAF
ncbi:MAG: asparaginase [Burkholderiaceae bacterium]